MRSEYQERIAVVIPCYREISFIAKVLEQVPDFICKIYVVDDACPEGTADYVETNFKEERITVLRHTYNEGVGAAVLTGYRQALQDEMTIIVKLDGDAQMDPKKIPKFIEPIIDNEADYTKGNRFYQLRSLKEMPKVRIIGNMMLTFLSKLSSGYWNLFDPTNGYTAIHSSVLRLLDLDNISSDFFFESDMLCHLAALRARVLDIPIDARYRDEKSSLIVHKVVIPFFYLHSKRLLQRLVQNYFIRDFSAASFSLVFGILLLGFGLIFGAYQWHIHVLRSEFASVGTVMLASLPLIIGMQLLLSFLNYDIANVPQRALHPIITNSDDGRRS